MLPLRLSAFLLWLALCGWFLPLHADETNLVADNAQVTATTSNSADDIQTLRALLILQEQLRQTQQEIEQTRLEADAASRRTAEILAARLNLIEQSLTAQRQREFDALQGSNQLLLIVVGVIAAVGFLSIAFSSWLQARAVGRLSQVSEQLRLAAALPPASGFPQLLEGDASRDRTPAHPANDSLMASIERLQRRIDGLEHSTGSTANGVTEGPHKELPPPGPSHQAALIAKGQSLLNSDQPAEALACFDDALGIEPNHVEAWIKKGTALERLQRSDEAIEAYDHAISADGATATAYLFKAGVFNRQKRYAEALQCYEKALSVQKSRAAAVPG